MTHDRRETGLNLFLLFNDYLANTDLQNFSSSLTAIVLSQMRAKNPGDNANLTLVPGDVFTGEPYIQVHWRWLTLFLMETLLTAGLLVTTIFLTRDEPLYKGSALVLLKHRIPSWEEDGSSSRVSIKCVSEVFDYGVDMQKPTAILISDMDQRLKNSAEYLMIQFDRGGREGEIINTTRARAQ
ncbi:hypothetical protein QBC36DRAFT_367345 [Triangularia setosa]|uniref:Uncharacterized protein n=1 Tax=Triangularia setosa TaxID=2587417 RepID=A0AAN6W051_9PEZI|nr:hypothetical protein QBC36DRAFT_367345 [Podospora setosa]